MCISPMAGLQTGDHCTNKVVNMYRKLIGWVILAVILTSCASKQSLSNIPQTDIVYQADHKVFNTDPPGSIGFVNADGSGNMIISLSDIATQPMVIDNGRTLVLKLTNTPNLIDYGYPEFITNSPNKYLVCNWEIPPMQYSMPVPNSKYIIGFSYQQNIFLADRQTCRIKKYIWGSPFNSNYNKGIFIGMATPSNDGREIVFDAGKRGNERQIYILDLKSGKVDQTGITGFLPTFSPDDRQIAYFYDNSLFISNSDGSEQKSILTFSPPFSDYSNGLTPIPFWSPDGKWILYHKCINTECIQRKDFDIFKVNVETGEEVLIVKAGLYPTWIK
jgi:hypothetical protein